VVIDVPTPRLVVQSEVIPLRSLNCLRQNLTYAAVKARQSALYLTHIKQQWGCWISQAVYPGRPDYRFPKDLRCQVALTRHR
jgi:hypothetical protein